MAGSSTPGQSEERTYIPFEPIAEPWSTYALSDGSVLRIRFVLLKMRRTKGVSAELPHGAELSSQVLVAIEPMEQFRGRPSSPAEISAADRHIEAEVGFETTLDAPAVYRFEGDRKLIVNSRPTKVQRTSVNGADGDRIYLVELGSEIAVMGGPTNPTDGLESEVNRKRGSHQGGSPISPA